MVDVPDREHLSKIVRCDRAPPFGGGTQHCLLLPDRKLPVLLEETMLDNTEDKIKSIWTFDHRVSGNP